MCSVIGNSKLVLICDLKFVIWDFKRSALCEFGLGSEH